jgi:DNA-3-methyladenine glycosylase I
VSARAAEKSRCPWAGNDPLYVGYHDTEWGTPVHDDLKHFEFLVLEAAQAGLSWITVLKKREAYRAAYRGFDPVRVARFGARDVQRLLSDAGIIRNRLKISSSIKNAACFLEVQKEFGSFDAYLWSWTGGKPVDSRWEKHTMVPPRTELSDAISKDLKARGFSFVGSTIIYSHLQAVGVVNDHLRTCFRGRELRRRPAASAPRPAARAGGRAAGAAAPRRRARVER